MAALDGLRTFAVLAVIFYHMGLAWAPGGLMGVTVFFVISGYLICGLLAAEYESTGTISLTRFWLRRVRRIIPAVLLALAGTLVICALLNPILFSKARSDLAPSLLFFNNWWQIIKDVSYFEAASAPSPLTHYWSLAIEEQFYIVWPLLLLLLFKSRMPRKGVIAIVGVLAALSVGEMALLYNPTVDPSRIYYGTDTRASSLLIGALLALVWPSTIFGHRRTQSKNNAARIAFNSAGVGALAGICAIVGFTRSYTAFPYYGGIALVSVLSAVLIAVLVVPNTWVARLLQLSPLVWIGKRSYGMYLWHYPVVLATTSIGSTIEVPWWVRLAQLVIIVALADLSYRFVETPIRAGALRAWWDNRRAGNAGGSNAPDKQHKARFYATSCICGALACGACVALAVMPNVTSAVPDYLANPSATSGAATSEQPSASSISASVSDSTSARSSSSWPKTSLSASASSTNLSNTSGTTAAVAKSSSADSSSPSSSSAVSPSSTSAKAASAPSASAPSISPSSTAAASTASAYSSMSSATSTSAASSPLASSASSASSQASSAPSAISSASAASAASAPTPAASAASTASAPAASSKASSASLQDTPSSGDASPAALPGIGERIRSALDEKLATFSDEEIAAARESLRTPTEIVVATVQERTAQAERKARKKAEKERRRNVYEKLFLTEHLNSGGGIIYEPLLIGDSVSAGCGNEFYKTFPYGHSDAQVNRNIWESPYEFYSASNQVGEYVVFCLGTNNAVVDEQIDELLAPVPTDKKVIFVNIRCPRDWEAQTNAAIAAAPERHDNIVAVVDWHAISAGHDEYFYEDGIHLNEVGAQAYIGAIDDAIKQTIK